MRPRIVEFFILFEKASTSGKETSIAQRVDRGKSVFFCYFLTFNCNYPLSYYKLLNNYKNISSIEGGGNMKKAYFSKRIWKKEINDLTLVEIASLSELFNRAKRFVFQTLVRQKRWNRELHKESIHLVVKKKFGVNDYIANSSVSESQALLKAQSELNKLYIKQTDEKIKKKLKVKDRTFFFNDSSRACLYRKSCMRGCPEGTLP